MNFKIIIISVAILSILSGCYAFNKQPYKTSELKSLKETKVGKIVLKNLDSIPKNDFTEDYIKDMLDGIDKNTMVREITSDFLVIQKKVEKDWQLSVVTTNSHHVMLCSIFENENLKLPPNINMKKVEDGMAYTYVLDGKQNDLKKIADIITLSGPKMCIAVPYKKFN